MNRKKLGIFFIRYQAVIILFYEFLILTIFYLITKFKFQNNNSLIMISLMLIVPIVFKIGTILIRKKNRIKYNTNHTNYYELILKDLKTNKLTKELLQKTNLNYKIEINNNNIIGLPVAFLSIGT